MPAAAMFAPHITDRALGRGECAEPVASVDGDCLAAGFHHQRAEADGHLPFWHVERLIGSGRLVLRDIGDKVVRHREGARAVEHLDDFAITELVTINARYAVISALRLCCRHRPLRQTRRRDGSRAQ